MLRRVLAACSVMSLWILVAGATADGSGQVADFIEEYLHGDAETAVATFSRMPLDPLVMQQRFGSLLTDTVFRTEVGMRRNTFGRYALSAPLVPASAKAGLDGMFEVNSLLAYRDIQQIVAGDADQPVAVPPVTGGRRPAEPPKNDPPTRWPASERSRGLVRDWYVVTVSYCLRWRLDCASALLGAAQRDLASDPDILLLAGSMSAVRGGEREAESLLRRALAAAPGLIEARLRLGRVLGVRGRPADARRELDRAVADARDAHDNFSLYFGLLSLADLDADGGRRTSERARRREAETIRPFDANLGPWIKDLEPWDVYRAAQLWQLPWRIRAMRQVVRGV